jgi:DNA-binding CsgD family transcriptional regulator
MTRLVASIYASLAGNDAQRLLLRDLAARFRSHLISLQFDQADHRHQTCGDYDASGQRMDEIARIAAAHPVENPWFASPAAMRLPIEGVMNEEASEVSPSALGRTEFHQVILRPFDIQHSFVFFLGFSGSGAATLGVSRSNKVGSFTSDEMRLAKGLLPHLQNLQRIQLALASRSFAEHDGARRAVWAISSDGNIVWRNECARSHVDLFHTSLRERSNVLHAPHATDKARLCIALRAVLGGELTSQRVLIRDERGIPQGLLHLHRCHQAAFLCWMLATPAAALAVFEPFDGRFTGIGLFLATAYGLTAAESRVVTSFAELGSVHAVATNLNRSEETIRSQLKAVFAKTGVNSQAELMRLLCLFAER